MLPGEHGDTVMVSPALTSEQQHDAAEPRAHMGKKRPLEDVTPTDAQAEGRTPFKAAKGPAIVAQPGRGLPVEASPADHHLNGHDSESPSTADVHITDGSSKPVPLAAHLSSGQASNLLPFMSNGAGSKVRYVMT